MSKPISRLSNEQKDIIQGMIDNVEDCFGKEFDIVTKECSVCADNEMCGIKFAEAIRLKVKEIEQIEQFLDTSDFSLIDVDDLKLWLALAPRPVSELIARIGKEAKSKDEVAVFEWAKRLIKESPELYTKDGITYTRK